MINQIILTGRIVKKEEIKKETNETIILSFTIAVPDYSKNNMGICNTNFIDIYTSKEQAEKVEEYCKIGDLVGIRGKIQKHDKDDTIKVLADKLTFLPNNSRGEDNE